jgi:hypothetical protein
MVDSNGWCGMIVGRDFPRLVDVLRVASRNVLIKEGKGVLRGKNICLGEKL